MLTTMSTEETNEQYPTSTENTERDGTKRNSLTTSSPVNKVTVTQSTIPMISHETTTLGKTLATDNSTALNITSHQGTNAPLAAIIAGTITGSLVVIACIVVLLVLCLFSHRNIKKSEDRVSHGHIYVNHGVVAHSIEDDGKTGIPRNISWKSLEQTHKPDNNVNFITNNTTDKIPFEQKNVSMSEKQISGTGDNYFILEKFYMNNDRDIEEEYYENCVQQGDNVNSREIKRENFYSLTKVPWTVESGNSRKDQPTGTEKGNIAKGREPSGKSCKDDDGDVYNKLGENSRNNSVVSAIANYDTMKTILHENQQTDTERIYYNDEDYSDNYDVLQFARKSSEPYIIPNNPYSTTKQIKHDESL